LGSVVLTSLLEWLTGLLLLTVFHSRWWDYTGMPGSIGGFICLPFSLIWGGACVVILRLILPSTDFLTGLLPTSLSLFLQGAFIALLLADLAASLAAAVGLHRQLGQLDWLAKRLKEGSDHLGRHLSDDALTASARYRERYDELLSHRNVLKHRLLDAFPNLKSEPHNEQLELLRQKFDRLREAAKERAKEFKKTK